VNETVTPAADLPASLRRGGLMVIVCLQKTARDVEALTPGGLTVHAKCDEFMEALMKKLGIDFPNTDEAAQAYKAAFERQVRRRRRRNVLKLFLLVVALLTLRLLWF
jgi:hypothetical protein